MGQPPLGRQVRVGVLVKMRSVVEVPLRIPKSKKIKTPCIETLEAGCKVGSGGGLVSVMTCGTDLACELNEWVVASMQNPIRLMGCWAYEVFDYRCDREFVGISAYLNSIYDVVHFQLAWSTHMLNDMDDFMSEAEKILS